MTRLSSVTRDDGRHANGAEMEENKNGGTREVTAMEQRREYQFW